MALNAPWTSPSLGCSLVGCCECFQFGVKKGHISRTLCSRWGHYTTYPFICAFYAFESPLFYSHYNRDGNIIVIPFAMGTCQGDLLGGALFVIIH